MGRLKLPTGIEQVSGQISYKPNKKTDQHWKHKDVMLAKHRKAPSMSDNCQSLFFVSGEECYKRVTAPSAREMANRLRFKTISQSVAERKIDLTRMSQDQQAFLAQKDLPNGIRTFNAWYWKQEADAYDAQHSNG